MAPLLLLLLTVPMHLAPPRRNDEGVDDVGKDRSSSARITVEQPNSMVNRCLTMDMECLQVRHAVVVTWGHVRSGAVTFLVVTW